MFHIPALLLAASSMSDQLVNVLTDDTFAGIHRLEFFDWALLLPYFALLFILSFYGMHRYEMVREYFKNRKNILSEPPETFEDPPRVTIQLPLYNERYVVERLIEQITKMDYPKDRLQIQVLDDSTDDTHPYTERLVEEYRARDSRSNIITGVTGMALKQAHCRKECRQRLAS